jgi:hypothetical protein
MVLPGDAFIVVFASGKDRRDPAGELHTNFKLNASGEYLAIANAESPRAIVMEYSPGFPDQRADLSWGLDRNGARSYFETPTPGKPSFARGAVCRSPSRHGNVGLSQRSIVARELARGVALAPTPRSPAFIIRLHRPVRELLILTVDNTNAQR